MLPKTMKPPEKTYIHARVTTRAKKESISQVKPGTYTIKVREKAERGQANKRVRELLAFTLTLSTKNIRLVKGATSPSKLFLVTNNTHYED